MLQCTITKGRQKILQKFKKTPTTLRIKHIYSVLKARQYTEHLIFPLKEWNHVLV
jgi:hypothetical protein